MSLILNANQTWEDISKEAKDEMLDSYWEHGFHLIPCGSKEEYIPEYFRKRHTFDTEEEIKSRWAKAPRVKWEAFQRTQPTREEMNDWIDKFPKANWAALTGINFVVLDADSQEAVDFIESKKITGTTLKQATPRGGMHFFYSVNPSYEIRNSAGQNKLDVRGTGGYVMMCPSHDYFFINESQIPVSDMDDLPCLQPEDLQKISEFNNVGKVQSIVTEKLDDVGTNIGTRNDKLARLVGRWVKEGWGQRDILIKAQDWNQSNVPPMSPMEVTNTTMSIVNGHIKRHPEDVEMGMLRWETSKWEVHLEDEQKEILKQEDPIENLAEDKKEKGPLGLMPWKEFSALDIEVPTEYWGDKFIFQRARVLMIGKPKIGKSHWLGAFATAAATGTEFMGKSFPRPLKVMWLQAEIIEAYITERVNLYLTPYETQSEYIDALGDNLIVSGRLRKNLLKDSDIDMVSEEIAFHKPDIVMLDPFINFFDGEENSNADIHKLLGRVDRLIELHNVCFIIAHHTGKDRQDDMSFMSARGGSVFAGWFDSGIKLLGEKPNVTLFYEARNAREPESHAAYFNFDTGLWNTVDFDAEKQVDEVDVAHTVANSMDKTKFYTRAELELQARKALKDRGLPSGVGKGKAAVSYVQKYLGGRVLTHAIPGKQTWHWLVNNEGTKPWEEE
jgi:hypothetical protein|tara:strand:- start:785 stop:2797 length:2013 start_codon:yes stop_codon:yes gene_type:complete